MYSFHWKYLRRIAKLTLRTLMIVGATSLAAIIAAGGAHAIQLWWNPTGSSEPYIAIGLFFWIWVGVVGLTYTLGRYSWSDDVGDYLWSRPIEPFDYMPSDMGIVVCAVGLGGLGFAIGSILALEGLVQLLGITIITPNWLQTSSALLLFTVGSYDTWRYIIKRWPLLRDEQSLKQISTWWAAMVKRVQRQK